MARKKLPEPPTKEELNKSSWIDVREHIPHEGTFYLVYSHVHGAYHIARWIACHGWKSIDGNEITVVTHWNDRELPLLFPVRLQVDEDIARQYGLNPVRTIYGVSI